METLTTERLALEPLTATHAAEMYDVLRDPALYDHLDYGPPASPDALRSVYRELEPRLSPDGSQLWLNWVVRLGADALGFVQATVEGEDAWVAYVLARAAWGRGYASEATGAVLEHLRTAYGVRRFLAVTEVANERSIALLTRLGFRRAGDGEVRRRQPATTERLFVRGADETRAR